MFNFEDDKTYQMPARFSFWVYYPVYIIKALAVLPINEMAPVIQS
jgi:hypothetical protein